MTSTTYQVKIFIAGDLSQIRKTCRSYCMCGLCITITPTEFVYTGGMETGAEIGLINYARFPLETSKIDGHAMNLARQLMADCCQRSCSVVTPTESHYLQNETIAIPR
jgi:hypothetical protein